MLNDFFVFKLNAVRVELECDYSQFRGSHFHDTGQGEVGSFHEALNWLTYPMSHSLMSLENSNEQGKTMIARLE